MRFDGEVPVGRLDKELATHTFYLQKDLSLDVPITDMLQKRIAIDDVHRPVGKGQVSCIGHDERYDVGLSTHITGHNVKSDDPVPNTKPEQLIFKLPIAIPNIKYSLSLSTSASMKNCNLRSRKRFPPATKCRCRQLNSLPMSLAIGFIAIASPPHNVSGAPQDNPVLR